MGVGHFMSPFRQLHSGNNKRASSMSTNSSDKNSNNGDTRRCNKVLWTMTVGFRLTQSLPIAPQSSEVVQWKLGEPVKNPH